MVMDVHGSRETAERNFGMSPDQTRTAALICALLIAGFAAIGIVILANTERPAGPSEISDCASVRVEADRLACLDGLARRPPEQPSKGGTGPDPRRAP
jgi:hypothetical protein